MTTIILTATQLIADGQSFRPTLTAPERAAPTSVALRRVRRTTGRGLRFVDRVHLLRAILGHLDFRHSDGLAFELAR